MVGYKAYVAICSPRPGIKNKHIIDAKSLTWAKRHAEAFGTVISVKTKPFAIGYAITIPVSFFLNLPHGVEVAGFGVLFACAFGLLCINILKRMGVMED